MRKSKTAAQAVKLIQTATRPDNIARGVSAVVCGGYYSAKTIPSGAKRARWNAKANAEEIITENLRHAASDAQRYLTAKQEGNFYKKQIADVKTELQNNPYGRAMMFNQELQGMLDQGVQQAELM